MLLVDEILFSRIRSETFIVGLYIVKHISLLLKSISCKYFLVAHDGEFDVRQRILSTSSRYFFHLFLFPFIA